MILFGLNFVLLLAWTLVDPLRFVRLATDDNSVATEDDVETYGACRSENKGLQSFGIPLLVVNIGALVLACIQAYRARGISDEYSESKYLAIAVASWFEVCLVGIPLLIIVDSNPTASYFLKASMIFIVSISLLLLVYLPKFFLMRKKRKEKENKANRSQAYTSHSAASSASSIQESGLRIVSAVPFVSHSTSEAKEEEYEKLKNELVACKEKIDKLEKERRNTSMISEDDVEAEETAPDISSEQPGVEGV